MSRVGWSARISIGLALILVVCAQAYVHGERSPGTPYLLENPRNVPFVVHAGTRAGLTNIDGEEIIALDSSPTAAILAALDRWSSITGSILRFDAPTAVESDSVQADSQSLITFADTPANRAITSGAVAVTQLVSTVNGVLTDTDIVFNPAFVFSTTLRPGTFDIEGTLVHELGHAIGMSHSGAVSSTMFAFTTRGSADLRSLATDDAAFARATYPPAGAPNLGSLIVDTRFANGQSARGVLVTAISRSTNTLFSSLSDTTGRAVMRGMPSGDYIIYAEPANGPANPSHFSQRFVQASIATTIAGGPDFPTTFFVQPFFETAATLTLRSGSDLLNIEGAGAAEEGSSVESDFGAIVKPGGNYFVELYGAGLGDPSVSLSSISFLGSGASILGPLERFEVEFLDGSVLPLLRFPITVAPSAPTGSLSVMVRLGDELAIFTALLEIQEPTPTPTFTSNGVVNAASFETGSISPGSIISIFGEELGSPETGIGVFDPLSGGLIEILQGVSVSVDGRPAPLFFVGPGQINAQAPAELQPGRTVVVRVLRGDARSTEALVPVTATSPGLFVIPESNRVIAINQDGTLNGPADAAERSSIVTLYATGMGAVDSNQSTGQPAPLVPLHHVVAPVVATIGGQNAPIHFAGLAPGFVGLVQINVEVPANAPVGAEVAVRLLASGITSQQATTLSIR